MKILNYSCACSFTVQSMFTLRFHRNQQESHPSGASRILPQGVLQRHLSFKSRDPHDVSKVWTHAQRKMYQRQLRSCGLLHGGDITHGWGLLRKGEVRLSSDQTAGRKTLPSWPYILPGGHAQVYSRWVSFNQIYDWRDDWLLRITWM